MRWLSLLLVAAMLAGCTDPQENDTAQPDPPDEPEEPAEEPPAEEPPSTPDDNGTPEPREPVTWEVEVRDNSFSAASLDVQVGDTVRWVRQGSNPHNVKADDGAYDSGDCPGLDCFGPATRQSYEHTFEAVGESGYYCSVHGSPGSGMAGMVTVHEVHPDRPA